MAVSETEAAVARARATLVHEHIHCENRHDVDAIMATFGAQARYDDEPWRDHRVGRDAVRAYYAALTTAVPDLAIEVMQEHCAGAGVVVEVVIRGTHLGAWRGLPATGRRLDFPLCGVFTFDAQDRIAGERIYYDRATVLRQLGLFHEPAAGLGRVVTVLSHPLTVARALLRRQPRTAGIRQPTDSG